MKIACQARNLKVEYFVDTTGQVIKAPAEVNASYAVATPGFIHIAWSGEDRTAIVTLAPEQTSRATVAAAAYFIGDLRPSRTIVANSGGDSAALAFPEYLKAIRLMFRLIGDVPVMTEQPAYSADA